MILGCTLPAALLLFVSVSENAPSANAPQIARLVQDRHRALIGMTARFSQVFRSGALGREVVERGVVRLKPPGRMRWEYREPEKKLFVSDGSTVYFYVPADRQVVVRAQDARLGLAFALLSGRSLLLEEFAVDLEAPTIGAYRLKMTPRQANPDATLVHLDLDDAGRILAIEILDAQGNRNLLRFEAIRENLRLPDRLFHFKIPEGVEVVQG